MYRFVGICAGLVAALGCGPAAAAAEPVVDGGTVVDGNVRFQVISPSLVRLEHDPDGRFEDRPTMLGFRRARPRGPVEIEVRNGRLVLDTGSITIFYERGSGSFRGGNLDIAVRRGSGTASAELQWDGPYIPPAGGQGVVGYATERPDDSGPRMQGNLGGWARGLDSQSGPTVMHEGLLSRDGWFFIDDSRSVLLRPGKVFARRSTPPGYQDGYLFGYGLNYRRALRDYRRLSGPVPFLPRKAFGIWFSRYFPYSAKDYRTDLLPKFRRNRVPLDVLVVDTDFKAPHVWAGWHWRSDLFPKPRAFIRWAHREGLAVPLNVHPSIPIDDPSYPQTLERAGGTLPPSLGGQGSESVTTQNLGVPHFTFEWSDPRHLDAYFALHEPFERDGIDFWWLDHCCEEARTLGLINGGEVSSDTWINSHYAERHRRLGNRWLPLSRIGASYVDWTGDEPGPWGAHRSAIHFTGDSLSTWEMLDFQTRFTAAEGAIGMPYVSHDIGGFSTTRVLPPDPSGAEEPYDPELYVRWVQSGAVQPILRLHSANIGDTRRLPWEFGGRAGKLAAEFLRFRGALVPHLYTLAERSYRTGLPMAEAMYLRWPRRDGAYRFDRQYMLGPDLLAAPVGASGDPATKRVWFPPGTWVDVFSGERHRGLAVKELKVPLERMPLFARSGSILPLAPYTDHTDQRPLRRLTLRVFAGAAGDYRLYEDAGDGFGYERGKHSRTPIGYSARRGRLRVGSARGSFPGQVRRRAYRVEIEGVRRPSNVTVNGETYRRWSYDPRERRLTLRARTRTSRPLEISYG